MHSNKMRIWGQINSSVRSIPAVNGYELNNLDNEALDAPVYNTMCNNPNLSTQPYQDGINNDFTSLPCETFLMSSRVNSDAANDNGDFSYKNPMYQSAHVQVKSKPIVHDEENYQAENSEEGICPTHQRTFHSHIYCFYYDFSILQNVIFINFFSLDLSSACVNHIHFIHY